MTTELNETWLHGKYVVNNHKVEINTSLPYIVIDGARIDFFQQDESAYESIMQIHAHWIKNDCSVEDSIAWFMDTYL